MVLTGIATSTSQTNMYALAASGNHRRKRSAKIAKKKLPRRRRKKQAHIKKRQRKVIKKHYKKHYRKHKPKVKKRRTKHGLTRAEKQAKEWVSWHESRDRWNIVSSVGCYGRYQLTPTYLHDDYSHINQSRTADRYVKNRYGGWIQAKRFWQAHNWY